MLVNIWKYKIEEAPDDYTYNELFTRFCIFLLFFDFIYTVVGVRYGFALSIYLFSIHCLLDLKKRTLGLVFFLLSGSIHTAFLMLGLIAYVLTCFNINGKRTFFIVIAISILFNSVVLELIAPLLGRRMDWYFSGKGTVTSYSNMTYIGAALYWGMKACSLPFMFILFKYFNKNSKWSKMALSWFILSVAFVGNAVIFLRAWWVFTSIGIYMLLDTEKEQGKLSYNEIRTVLLCSLLFISLKTINAHSVMLNSRYYRLIMPTPYILSSTYTKGWIFENIDSHGNIQNYE